MGSLNTEIRSKVMSHDAELYLAGCKAFAGGDLLKASKKLADAVRENDVLLWTLARYYIENFVAPDMTGERLSSARSGHHFNAGGHAPVAAPRGPVEEGVRPSPISREVNAGLPAPSSPPERGGAVQRPPLGQTLCAPPLSPVPGGEGHIANALGHTRAARPTRKPNPPRGRRAFEVVKLSLFDTYKVRDGRPIGDLTVFEARKMAVTNEREARILRAICNHVGGYVEPGTPLRNALKIEVLERAVAQNMEISDVA